MHRGKGVVKIVIEYARTWPPEPDIFEDCPSVMWPIEMHGTHGILSQF